MEIENYCGQFQSFGKNARKCVKTTIRSTRKFMHNSIQIGGTRMTTLKSGQSF